MNKILGLDSAYTEAIEKRGRNMLISANLVSEIVDRIRELEDSGWISVDDCLPELGIEVLTINSECIEVAQRVEAEEDGSDYMGHDEGFSGPSAFPGRSFGAKEYLRESFCQPTHWMPLPPAPLNE